MIYYVDGYNLLFRLLPKKKSLEVKRTDVIETLNSLAKELHLNIVLVFDATQQKERLGIARGHYDVLEIIYTENATADNYILDIAQNAKQPSQMTVVTSDRELAHKAKIAGARTLTISSFIERLKQKKHKAIPAPKEFKDSSAHIQRLLKIFTERFENEK
jgi:predicted RNA-binding protein with PIN domain